MLVELRDLLAAELEATGKADWARQEFEHLKRFEQPTRVEAWRRTSGLHRVRGRRALGAVRALWETRDDIARQRDVTPGRIIPDAAIVAAAQAMPSDRAALLSTRGFHGRGAERYAARWVAALQEVRAMAEADLPTRSPRGDGPPLPRAWAEKDPVAARRLQLAREALTALAEEQGMPAEQLLTPDYLRRALWAPPQVREPGALLDEVAGLLAGYGARSWQIGLTSPILTRAILDAEVADDLPEPAERGRPCRDAADDEPDGPRLTRCYSGLGDALSGARTCRDASSISSVSASRSRIGTLSSSRRRGATALSSCGVRVQRRLEAHRPHAAVEDRGVRGRPAGLQEVVGERHLEVGRDEVAGPGHARHRRGGERVDQEVGGLGGVRGRRPRGRGR